MNLTDETVAQIAEMNFKHICCKKAFLSAIAHTCASLNFTSEGLSVIINCPIIPRIKEFFDLLYPNSSKIENGVLVVCKEAVSILLDLDIFCTKNGKTVINEGISEGLTQRDCDKRAYLAGAFVGCGSLTIKSGYNLEFTTVSKKVSLDISNLLNQFGIKSLYGGKNRRFRAYIKDKEGVCDALAAIGASKTVLKISDIIAQRDLRKQTSRQANCDMYNLDKSVAASMLQIEAINNLNLTDQKLIDVANARLNHPDASYEELKDILNVSKSTIKYRLNKIVELYKSQSQ